jgi:hypothetical protein
MRRLLLATIFSLTAALLVPSFNAVSQTAGPGGGHGFLIDKHVAAHVTCAQCHAAGMAVPPATAACLTCHGGTYQKLAASTAKDTPNPHESHQGEIPCSACHHVHKSSQLICNNCHNFDLTAP